MPKAKTRTRIVYRDRPANNYFSLDTVKRIKDWFYVVLPIGAALWIVAGPYVDAKAGDYLRVQLERIGMDPATVQALNKNLTDLQETVKEKDATVDQLSRDVGELKGDIGKVLILLQTQQQPIPAPIAEPVK